jgi:membrane-associated progesterone receptor component
LVGPSPANFPAAPAARRAVFLSRSSSSAPPPTRPGKLATTASFTSLDYAIIVGALALVTGVVFYVFRAVPAGPSDIAIKARMAAATAEASAKEKRELKDFKAAGASRGGGGLDGRSAATSARRARPARVARTGRLLWRTVPRRSSFASAARILCFTVHVDYIRVGFDAGARALGSALSAQNARGQSRCRRAIRARRKRWMRLSPRRSHCAGSRSSTMKQRCAARLARMPPLSLPQYVARVLECLPPLAAYLSLPPSLARPHPPSPSPTDLAGFTGVGGTAIYVAADGIVFDVSSGKDF